MSRRSRADDGPGLDGILVVAKPAGPTSHDIVALVRRLAVTRRVGHGGTLDPFATGVLPVFLGRATRLVEYHLGDRKRYRATICFGARSTTDDLDGELTPVDGPGPDRSAVEAALGRVAGRSSRSRRRTPRSSSAAGAPTPWPGRGRRRSSRRARSRSIGSSSSSGTARTRIGRSRSSRSTARPGRTSGRSPAISAQRPAAPPTSVRSTRTASGGFSLEGAHPLEAIRAAVGRRSGRPRPLLLPIDAGLDRFPRVVLTDVRDRRRRARPVRPPGAGLPDARRPGRAAHRWSTSGRPVAVGRDPRRSARTRQGARRPTRRPPRRRGRAAADRPEPSERAMDVVHGDRSRSAPRTAACSSSSGCSTGSTGAIATSSTRLRRAAARPRRPPGGHHLRCAPR